MSKPSKPKTITPLDGLLDLPADFLVDNKERHKARELISRYISEYLIETYADKQLVRHLVYLEVIQYRLQLQLNDLHKRDNVVPAPMLELLQRNLESITKARSALGLNRANSKDSKSTESYIDLLKAKFAKYREENQGTRTIKCPHEYCGKYILLKIRTDKYDAVAHPYFKDNILTNDHLVKLFIDSKITKEDVALILNVSNDYVDWLVERWKEKVVTVVPITTSTITLDPTVQQTPTIC